MRLGSVSLLVLAACVLTSACSGAPAPSSPPPASAASAAELLARFGWTPVEGPVVTRLEIPTADELEAGSSMPFSFYVPASRRIGLDFTPYAGRTLDLQTYVLARVPDRGIVVRGHVLVDGSTPVGAWLSAEPMAPGVFALDTPLEELLR